jgi:hypothetical protein
MAAVVFGFLSRSRARREEPEKGEEWRRQEGVGGARVAGLGLLVFKEGIKLGRPSHLSGGQRGCHVCAAVQRRRRPGRERADLGGSGLRKKVSAGLQGPVGPLCFFPFFFSLQITSPFLAEYF